MRFNISFDICCLWLQSQEWHLIFESSVLLLLEYVYFLFFTNLNAYIWENNNNYKTIHLLEVPYTYMGCFEDSSVLQDLPVTTGDTRATPSTCRRVCYLADYRYAAVSRENWCHCGCVLLALLPSIFTVRNEDAKVMFLQVCVCPQGGAIPACIAGGIPACLAAGLKGGGGYPSMLCRFPGSQPRGKFRGSVQWGEGVFRPTPKGEVEGIQSRPTPKGEVEGDLSRWGGLQAHSQGGS